MKRYFTIPLLIIFLAGCLLGAVEKKYRANWESLDSRPIPGWFPDAKFGIFIHWGVYSVPSWRTVSSGLYASYAEWYYARVMNDLKNGGAAFHNENFGQDFEYRDFAPLFKAELFDPDDWAALFKRSGARYVVLTSKHHDGFCLWPSKSPYKQNWNSADIGPKRDLVGDLTRAVRRQGLKMGLYYSIIEWETNPTHRTESGYFLDKKLIEKYAIPADKYIDDHMIPQLKELVKNYQPSLIFSDAGEWDRSAAEWKTSHFLAWLYNEAPNRDEVVVNDRWGKDMPGRHGDYFSSEYEDTDAVGTTHPWEESRGVGGSYGFNRDENIDDYSTSKELIHELIDIVSRGGNLLLNVGPTADGRIPVIMQQRLVDIGRWLETNGESIYESRSWALSALNQGHNPGTFYTKKGADLYIICSRWPENTLSIQGVQPGPKTAIRLLGSESDVHWEFSNSILKIIPPDLSPAQAPGQHAFVFALTDMASLQTEGSESITRETVISQLGHLLKPAAERTKAREAYETARANFILDPNEENTIWFGRRAAYLSRYNEAIRIYSDGLIMFPDSYKLYRHRGHRYISKRQFPMAISDLKQAVLLIEGKNLEIEADGQPNRLNQPLSNSHFNIWYHLGLAYYLQSDFKQAVRAYRECLKWSVNDDLLTATADWLYMALRRQGKQDEAARLLERIRADMTIIENMSYHHRLLMYKGERSPESLLKPGDRNADDYDLTLATQGYGVANWYLYNGDQAEARKILTEVLQGKSWSAFGYIAAETDLARMIRKSETKKQKSNK